MVSVSPWENINLHLPANESKKKAHLQISLFILWLPRVWREVILPADSARAKIKPVCCFSHSHLILPVTAAQHWLCWVGEENSELVKKSARFSDRLQDFALIVSHWHTNCGACICSWSRLKIQIRAELWSLSTSPLILFFFLSLCVSHFGVYCGGFCMWQICNYIRAALNYHRDQNGAGCAENFFKLLVFSFLFSSYRKKNLVSLSLYR